MSTSAVFLEYLRVFLSTPVVIGVVSTTFLLLFKDQIKSLLARTARIKLGSAELSAPQPPPEAITPAAESTPSAEPQDLTVQSESSIGDIEQLRVALQEERNHALLWEFRFLNYYLVPATQSALDWFSSLSTPTTFNMYDSSWQATVPIAMERKNIIGALESHNLIEYRNELLAITDKGREYIRWRGPRYFPTTYSGTL